MNQMIVTHCMDIQVIDVQVISLQVEGLKQLYIELLLDQH